MPGCYMTEEEMKYADQEAIIELVVDLAKSLLLVVPLLAILVCMVIYVVGKVSI